MPKLAEALDLAEKQRLVAQDIMTERCEVTTQLQRELIQDVELTKFDQPVKRHDGTNAPPVKDRPGTGHIGFQHLSRDDVPVQIRNARIMELKP